MGTSATVDRFSQPTDGTLRDQDRFREVWDGEDYMPPMPNNEHFLVQLKLALAFTSAIDLEAGDFASTGGNVSDRDRDWTVNYRCPDALVALRSGRAIDRSTHWFGGPDIVVEVISDTEDPLIKLAFYESIGVREFVVIERDPWAVELFRLDAGKLASVGRSDETNGAILDSVVLPVRYGVIPGSVPVRVEVSNLKTNQTWNLAG
ncbi:MAG: Uma2 family endonuclease [Planctomycetia bacterium]|nr:Uma2 family endonuclease [Planctomycetia bacterium]